MKKSIVFLLLIAAFSLTGCVSTKDQSSYTLVPPSVPKNEPIIATTTAVATTTIATTTTNTATTTSNGIDDWKLIYDGGSDDCAVHIYEGKRVIGGWYSYEQIYSEKEWIFRVLYYYDKNGIKKNFDNTMPDYYRLKDVTSDLEARLKRSTDKDPIEITIQGQYFQCEGAAASIEPASKAFADDIKRLE